MLGYCEFINDLVTNNVNAQFGSKSLLGSEAHHTSEALLKKNLEQETSRSNCSHSEYIFSALEAPGNTSPYLMWFSQYKLQGNLLLCDTF